MKKILAKIEKGCITEQQEEGYKAYYEQVMENDRVPSIEDFIHFYQYWQVENGYFSDTNVLDLKVPKADYDSEN